MYANIRSFYLRDLSIQRLWYLKGVPVDMEGPALLLRDLILRTPAKTPFPNEAPF